MVHTNEFGSLRGRRSLIKLLWWVRDFALLYQRGFSISFLYVSECKFSRGIQVFEGKVNILCRNREPFMALGSHTSESSKSKDPINRKQHFNFSRIIGFGSQGTEKVKRC